MTLRMLSFCFAWRPAILKDVLVLNLSMLSWFVMAAFELAAWIFAQFSFAVSLLLAATVASDLSCSLWVNFALLWLSARVCSAMRFCRFVVAAFWSCVVIVFRAV